MSRHDDDDWLEDTLERLLVLWVILCGTVVFALLMSVLWVALARAPLPTLAILGALWGAWWLSGVIVRRQKRLEKEWRGE